MGRTFLAGYHAALFEPEPLRLAAALTRLNAELSGFGFEGAAMGLALLDFLSPRGRRIDRFLAGPASGHAYMVHVGVGWAAARVPWVRARLERHLVRRDRLLRWLVVDGYGFHDGYFLGPRVVRESPPKALRGYARRAYDQGLGRSLWFIGGGNAAAVADLIARFARPRQADLWSGAGLACAYAGAGDETQAVRLAALAGPYRSELAQGAAFAAQARRRAGNSARHTAAACEAICGRSAEQAATITRDALTDLPGDDDPAYEVWRARIRARLA